MTERYGVDIDPVIGDFEENEPMMEHDFDVPEVISLDLARDEAMLVSASLHYIAAQSGVGGAPFESIAMRIDNELAG